MGKLLERLIGLRYARGDFYVIEVAKIIKEFSKEMPKFNWGDSISLFKEKQDEFLEVWLES